MSTHAIAERAPILSCLALLLFLGACGAGRSGLESAQSLSLRVVNTLESASGQAAQFSVLQRTDGNDITVDLEVHGASELQACGVELSYSAEDWHLVDSQGTALLGDSDSVLELVLDAAPGLLAFGTVQTRGCTALPFSGSGKLASFRFAPGPAGQRRTVSAINSSPPAAEWDEGSLRLSWPYGNVGDYDQNSEVNIADLTPIGIHFGESSADPLSALAAIDGDSNGEINIADITPIGINYRNGLSGYRLWELASPLDWQGPQTAFAFDAEVQVRLGRVAGDADLADYLAADHPLTARIRQRWPT